MDWFLDPIKNHYTDFKGRASRQQYWMFVLYYVIIAVIVAMTDAAIGTGGIFGAVLSLALLLPSLALVIRRLHDTGKTAWFVLLGFIPLVNLVLLFFMVQKGDVGPNKYGANPNSPTDPTTTIPNAEQPTETPSN